MNSEFSIQSSANNLFYCSPSIIKFFEIIFFHFTSIQNLWSIQQSADLDVIYLFDTIKYKLTSHIWCLNQ